MYNPNLFLEWSVKVAVGLEVVLNERLKTLVFDVATVLPLFVPFE